MLKLLIIGECTAEPYIDASLTYISEVDPMWESDLLTLVLNPRGGRLQTQLPQWCALLTVSRNSRKG
ncbi:hypothetical protein ACLB1E_34755 [Escherichia coli]